jgi:hypothetical protein
MDILDQFAEPVAVTSAFTMMAVIVHNVGRCIRAFVQGINEADDPRHARLPSTDAEFQQARCRRRGDEHSVKTSLIWMIAYFASVPIFFVCLTSGGWVRVDHTPEMLVSLILPLLLLRLFAYFLRLGRFFQHRPRRR